MNIIRQMTPLLNFGYNVSHGMKLRMLNVMGYQLETDPVTENLIFKLGHHLSVTQLLIFIAAVWMT